MKILTYEKGFRDLVFYGHIGPYALNRSVTGELHDQQYGSIYDEPERAVWFIAVNNRDELLGFCTLFDREKDLFFDNTYVIPAHRRNGIGEKLFKARLEYAKGGQNGRKIKGITQNEIQRDIYTKHGFQQASKRGRYYWMEKSYE
jgi:GNAT superfamily N-acetyltransferase